MLNPSGITPTEFKVLVEPTPIEEKIGSIILPDQKQEHDKFAQTKGKLIAVSPLAFAYATPSEWEATGSRPPKPGDSVLFVKYGGARVKGKDGKEYVLINDKDILATTEE